MCWDINYTQRFKNDMRDRRIRTREVLRGKITPVFLSVVKRKTPYQTNVIPTDDKTYVINIDLIWGYPVTEFFVFDRNLALEYVGDQHDYDNLNDWKGIRPLM